MSDAYIPLDHLDLALAAGFLLLNGLFSLLLGLGLERRLLIAGLRMSVQLILVGLVLKALFDLAQPWLVLLVALVMVAVAGREIWARQQRRLGGPWGYGIGTGAALLAGGLITLIGLGVHIQPEPWWSPRYALPLLGMILGNLMTGVALAVDSLHDLLHRERSAVEARLLLGYTRREALLPVLRRALHSGFTPIINAMAATGIVSLPGMMTGQIMSGVSPEQAVKYQLLVMFLIGGATGLGVLLAVFASAVRLTDGRHRLRLDRLAPGDGFE